MKNNVLLDVKDLVVRYETDDGVVRALNSVSLSLEEGRILGVVGETGREKPPWPRPSCS